ncbi:hypothetical protein JZ751_013230 [Albula glossodonta]|uniref:U3 small nucleolar RNA-associated protein 18 homolog n=1 Tax=Albula glossodonta TaxID=121402 RepID=A0A8T2NUF8_9TELE|nr:hypothetical protein JZ751_013230 [Albula glossodonta]
MDKTSPNSQSKKGDTFKRKRNVESDVAQLLKEESKRQKHLSKLKALGERDESEKLLEDLVFGAEDELLEKLTCKDEGHVGSSLLDEESSDSEVENEARLQVPAARKAAWEDDEDDEAEVDMTHRFRRDFMKGSTEGTLPKQKLQHRLQEQFQKAMGGTPSWAEEWKENKKKDKHSEDEDDDDDNLLRRTGNFVGSSESLPHGIIQIKKCLDANNARLSDGRLTTVQFHPSAQVVMTAGEDQSISLFQSDHVLSLFSLGLNEKNVKEFEVSPDGMYLLLSGRSGYLHLVTMKTKELVRSFKINGEVTAATFSQDSGRIYVSSGESTPAQVRVYTCVDEGEVYIWDTKTNKCVNRFSDDGSLKGTSIAVSRNGQYIACGPKMVVVFAESNPKPLKAIMNLLTSVTSLRFNPSTEMLAIASSAAEEAIRLVHIPSFSVFSNYPVSKRSSVFRPQCLDFSPNSGFFSVANNKGKALLYRYGCS